MGRNKCIVIGSGLGGLSAGLILARNGWDVTVLEQGAVVGGCLQCFTRRGTKFETGMHFIGSAREGEILHQLMRYLSLDSLELSELDRSCYEIVNLAGDRFEFANGRDGFIEKLGGYFPTEVDSLKRYFNIIEQIGKASTIEALSRGDVDLSVMAHYQTVSINEVLDSIFWDETLKRVLVGNLPLYSGELDRTPFAQHAFIMNFYNRSTFRFVGGSDVVAVTLRRSIETIGGRVECNAKATRIICDNRRATAVEVNGSVIMDTDLVVGAIHPASLMRLLDTRLIRPAYRNRLLSLHNTASPFSVHIKFRPRAVPYMNSNIYSYRNGDPWGCENYTDEDWPKGYMYMHMCHSNNQEWADSAVVVSYMNYDDVSRWNGTQVGRRGDDYLQFKERMANRLLGELERDYPGTIEGIENYYTSTPLTYQDYTGTERGSMYGVAKDITSGPAARVSYRTRVPNLVLTGQNINSHGILGVLVGTIVACSWIVGQKEIYRQLIEANS